MKFRIVEVRREDGTVTYRVDRKDWFGWHPLFGGFSVEACRERIARYKISKLPERVIEVIE